MVAEWRYQVRGTFLVHVAVVNGCELSIVGGEGAWFWLVRRDRRDLAEGREPQLADAQEMAEAAARRLARDPGAR